MELEPSEILFSQDSINNTFSEYCDHKYQLIGETLDKICKGRTSINEIPNIRVVKRNDKWVTCDNRRLWIFQHLERLGKCDKIPVKVWSRIPEEKLTSLNGGRTIRVRDSPGGSWHDRDPPTPKPSSNNRWSYDSKYHSALPLNTMAVSSVTSTPSYITNVKLTTMMHTKTEVSQPVCATPSSIRHTYGQFSFFNNNAEQHSVASSMLEKNNHAQQVELYLDQHDATNPSPEAHPEPPPRRRSKRFRKPPDWYGQRI